MNKHCFRLIFSKSLGFLIPVAEICSAQRKPGQPSRLSSSALPSPPPSTRWNLKALPLALFGLLPNAFADMVVEPGQQTRMTQSANGVPVIEIADPNSKGLSHNRFEQFNVSQPGVIFNNSMQDGTSQIGSHVIHNSNLTREAKAILTEVTGNSPSTLAGTLEVFGGKADILIANKSADGSYRVDGKTTAATLREFRDKDGGYIGGSAGTSKSGIPSFVMEAGRVDQVDYKATQNATVDLGAVEMNVGKGITGQLNRDASKQTEVSQNTKTAGTDIRIEISLPAPKNKPPVDDETPPARRPEAESAPPKPPVDAVDGGGGGNDTNARHMSEHTTGNDLKSALAKINSPIRADQADIQNNPVTVHVRNAAGEVETFKIRNNADLENLNGKIIVTGQQAEGLPVPKGYGKSSTLYIQLVKHSGGGYTYKLTPKKPTGIIDKSW